MPEITQSQPNVRIKESIANLGLFSLWRNKNFVLLWSGQSISVFGDYFYSIALSWAILDITGSTTVLGTLLMLSSIPRLALMALGGVFTDRFQPRSVMLWSDGVRGVLVALLGGLVLAGQLALWPFFILSIVFGVVDAFFFPASNSILPRLVDDEAKLQSANSLMQTANQLATFLGPALAGVLVAHIGVGPAFLVDAASFGISALTLLAIQAPTMSGQLPSRHVKERPGNVLTELREGLAYVWQTPLIRTLILLLAFLNLGLTGPAMVGLPQLARGPLNAGAQGFGFLMSAFGLGSVVGAMSIGALGSMPRRGRTSIALMITLGFTLLALGFATRLIHGVVLIVALGVALAALNVILITLLQSKTNARLLGRVMSVATLSAMGLTPVSYGLAGVIGDLMGVRALFVLGGVIIALSALAGLLVSAVRSVN